MQMVVNSWTHSKFGGLDCLILKSIDKSTLRPKVRDQKGNYLPFIYLFFGCEGDIELLFFLLKII